MRSFLTFALLLIASAPPDHPRTYLASIVNIPLRQGESIESFSIATWGVEFTSICKIPSGWRLKAGRSATPDGVLEGEGSQGATWFNRSSPTELRNIVLITLYDTVQREDVHNGPDATFKGHVLISGPERERKAALNFRNIRLSPARRCP